MNRYEKVRLELEGSIRKVQPSKNFSEVIDEYSKKGYRFKQVFVPTGKNGTPKFYDIIFERIDDNREYMYDYLQIEIDHKVKNNLLVEDYWEDVYAYDVKGWRFVTIFAPASLKGGVPKYYELVFEKEVFKPGLQYQFNQYEQSQEQLPGGQSQIHAIPHEEQAKPSDDKKFLIPNELSIGPIHPTNPPLEIENQNIKSLPVIEVPALEQENKTIEKEKLTDLPVFKEEDLNRYEVPNKETETSNESSNKEKMVFKDELTKEIIDKDYAKRFFNQIQKTEEKVPMESKPTNVGFVEFEDEE